ncbi:MAG: KH domain-containing protein [Candidatus Micrarchaeia archaeon]|jgi:exosome complex component RRP4
MDKRIVLPGEMVLDKPLRAEGTFVEGGKTFASVLSLFSGDKVIPLKGKYVPNYGDYVVGIVKEELFSGYVIDLNSPYEGKLSTKDTREEFRVGDVVSVKIMAVDEVNNAMVVEPRRLVGGEILEIESVKVPRVIGRNGSMLQMLQEATGSEIFVGKNGRIYLKGGNSHLASLAIMKICREAHTSGLTDRIQAFLRAEAASGNGFRK